MHAAEHQGWCVMPAVAASVVVFSEMLARHWLIYWRQMQQMKNCWLEQFGCSGFTGVCGWNQGKFGL
ncbi:unnamed protein product [Sphagnum jensenii]|uniref:Uncharacterized protein n=1 Tax=Sphagnum jensenii TaxID=128206 RepID=A0ABP0X6N8_9BRYO